MTVWLKKTEAKAKAEKIINHLFSSILSIRAIKNIKKSKAKIVGFPPQFENPWGFNVKKEKDIEEIKANGQEEYFFKKIYKKIGNSR